MADLWQVSEKYLWNNMVYKPQREYVPASPRLSTSKLFEETFGGNDKDDKSGVDGLDRWDVLLSKMSRLYFKLRVLFDFHFVPGVGGGVMLIFANDKGVTEQVLMIWPLPSFSMIIKAQK